MMRKAVATIRALLRDERGNVIALTAIGIPLILGSAALAVDTIQWVYAKREVQAAADAAAEAGVYGLIQAGDLDVAVDRSVAANAKLDARRAVTAERSPAGHEADPFAVKVRISVPASMSFAQFFLRSAPTITAEATATVVENGEFCAFAIGSDDETGLEIDPGSDLEMECGLATNSSSARAIEADGSAAVRADNIVAFGGIDAKGVKSPRVRPYGVRQKDPLAKREPPLVPSSGCPNVTVNPDAALTNGGRIILEPGCYGNLLLDGPTFLADGEYILNRGNLVIGPAAEVTCKACTIWLTSEQAATDPWSVGKVQIDGRAKVKLAAPVQGPNAGLLIFQDRRAAGAHDQTDNIIAGNGFSEFKGLIYVPSETLRIDGTLNPDLKCGRFIGRRLVFKGRVLVAKECSSSSIMNFRGTEVRLVG